MAQTKPKAAQFYGVSGHGTAGQVLISDGNGGMSWGANTEEFTVSWATPTGQSLTYTQPNPQSSTGSPGGAFPTTTFTATKSGEEISGTASIAGLPTGITASQSLSGSGADNVLTVTLSGVFPGADSLNTALTISGLTVQVPLPPLTVEYLVVAGGGGGGAGYYGGGAGAGGLRTSYGSTSGGGGSAESTLSLSASINYTLTVGAGGAGATNTSIRGASGQDSVFSTITSTGGGGGGSRTGQQQGADGGSGGGVAYNTGGSGQGVAGQGFAGAAASSADYGTGGGGASAVGQAASGNGGDGLAVSITGSSVTYAGGGGGGGIGATYPVGSGGAGGGGAGGDAISYPSSNGPGSDGTANTGGGGGGSGGDNIGGNGGSGIVILRYPSGYTISGLSGTTTTVGTDKVTTFTNAGTGTIQFN